MPLQRQAIPAGGSCRCTAAQGGRPRRGRRNRRRELQRGVRDSRPAAAAHSGDKGSTSGTPTLLRGRHRDASAATNAPGSVQTPQAANAAVSDSEASLPTDGPSPSACPRAGGRRCPFSSRGEEGRRRQGPAAEAPPAPVLGPEPAAGHPPWGAQEGAGAPLPPRLPAAGPPRQRLTCSEARGAAAGGGRAAPLRRNSRAAGSGSRMAGTGRGGGAEAPPGGRGGQLRGGGRAAPPSGAALLMPRRSQEAQGAVGLVWFYRGEAVVPPPLPSASLGEKPGWGCCKEIPVEAWELPTQMPSHIFM